MEKVTENKESCLNCGALRETNFKFCPECGQEFLQKQTLSVLFSQFLNDYFTFDSKIGRSILPLITRPGFLTLEYLRGKRVHYIPPLRLFIFLSIIFFILLGLSSPSVEFADESSISDQFWDQYFESRLPKLFFILLPVFAGILRLLFNRKKYSWLSHFLFALHFHSSLFLLGIVYFLLSKLFILVGLIELNSYVLGLFSLYLFYYLAKSLHHVYHQTWLKVTWKLSVLILLYLISLTVSSLALLAILLGNQ